MRILFFILAIVFSAKSFALTDMSSVKVRSSLCGEGNILNGSGLLFSYGNGWYVLTSEAVVYHSQDEKYCHRIQEGGGAELNVKLKAVSWEFGLAVLELQANTLEDPKNLSKFIDLDPTESRPVSIEGFEALSSKPVEISAEIASPLSPRVSIPKQRLAHEVSTGPRINLVQSGVIGGPVFTVLANTYLVGIVSNQYLKMEPGMAASPKEWQPNSTEKKGRVLVIPFQNSNLKWIGDVLGGKAGSSVLSRDPSEHWSEKASVVGYGMKFTSDCPKSEHPSESANWPIGGGDGVGIGGANPKYACKVRVKLITQNFSSEVAWIESLRAKLAGTGGTAEISILTRKGRAIFGRTYQTFSGLGHFFKLIQEGGIPAPVIRAREGEIGVDPKLYSLRKLARKASIDARAINAEKPVSGQVAYFLLKSIYRAMELLESEEIRQVAREELTTLLTDHKEAWQVLEFAQKAKALKVSIEAVLMEYDKMVQP